MHLPARRRPWHQKKTPAPTARSPPAAGGTQFSSATAEPRSEGAHGNLIGCRLGVAQAQISTYRYILR